MSRFHIYKIVQLTILILLTLFCLICLLRPSVKELVFADTGATLLFISDWCVLAASYVFLLLDFRIISNTKQDFSGLYEAAYADPLSGIPNRFSCDVLIDKYYNQPLPETIGCIMMDLDNLPDINSQYGHSAGNKALRHFSDILMTASQANCFVGRNGGNKFLAIFEECTPEILDDFLKNVNISLNESNEKSKSFTIDYKAGKVFNGEEHLDSITKLISLANSRIYRQNSESRQNSEDQNGGNADA